MAIKNVYNAESWTAIYQAFNQVNFTSYDYDTVKAALIQYCQIYFSEVYNDFIESSELLALIEIFAYCSELLAYRVDTVAHENFITTAQRKQSVLRLAKLIAYSASRNTPARGLVKINTIRTDETVYDSLGNNLAGQTITWNDPNNTNWNEQFLLVMNLVLTSQYGQPSKVFQVADVLMQQYTFNNNANAFRNGVFAFSSTSSNDTVNMEVVPIDIDANGPFEKSPDINSQFSIIYASDGKGNGSDYTGFLMFVKQGDLTLTTYSISEPIANRRLVLNQTNVNNIDVWVYQVDESGSILQTWEAVNALEDQTLSFNDIATNYKYEIETLENDQIALVFGDGNFSAVPVGLFQLWTRSSVNQNLTVPKSSISNQAFGFAYTSTQNVIQNVNITFSLTSALQNNAPSEQIEHIRQAAPSTYYAQNRMVNGQDYNTFPLKDPTILKLNTINRTFAGQPKYLEWNDASGAYQNIKLFGDDLILQLETSVDSTQTTLSSKGIIDTYIEPALSTNALLNVLTHQMATASDYVIDNVAHSAGYGIISYPRRVFIEDNRKIYYDVNGNFVSPYGVQLDGNHLQVGDGSLLERTVIQGALDGHWYGEPLTTVVINGTLHGQIPDPILDPESDSKLYISDLPRTVDGINTYPPGDTGSGLQAIQRQKYFGLRFNRYLAPFGNGTIAFTSSAVGLDIYQDRVETLTIEMTSDGTTFTVISNLRGKLPDYSLTIAASTEFGNWSEQMSIQPPVDFSITAGSVAFEAGDAFIVDLSYMNPALVPNGWGAAWRRFGTSALESVNLSGWWELIPSDVVTGSTTQGGLGLFASGADDGPNEVQQLIFDQSGIGSDWIFLIARTDDTSGNVSSWNIYNRDMKIIASSPTTNFWFNQSTQILDPDTLKPLYDKIRILRSNIDGFGQALVKADIYDCINFAYDSNGEVITNSLELLPTDTINFIQSGDSTPDNVLQFENFAQGSYQYTLYNVADPNNPVFVQTVPCGSYTQQSGYDVNAYDTTQYDVIITNLTLQSFSGTFTFAPGNFLSNTVNNYVLGRQLYVPAPAITNPQTNVYGCNVTKGLDFMWQHYTPDTNLIDPSPSNIHDAYILTSGYYTSVMSYVQGLTSIIPTPPTPLDLRTSYGYLLESKTLSDTVVLHPGKIKLLFGTMSDQTLQAKFRVVISPTATFSNERIQQEVINTINKFFDISNWNFGDTFYATQLQTAIHQALSTQISSVVIVPTSSVGTFGSLFTINSGLDEVLQSCAQITDVQIVSALTPSILRQS